jgi:hypothetical protein
VSVRASINNCMLEDDDQPRFLGLPEVVLADSIAFGPMFSPLACGLRTYFSGLVASDRSDVQGLRAVELRRACYTASEGDYIHCAVIDCNEAGINSPKHLPKGHSSPLSPTLN